MTENFKEKVLTQDVNHETKCELIATEELVLTSEKKSKSIDEVENPCSFMGIISAEAFVAELYMNYIYYNEDEKYSNALTKTIENAIWRLDDCWPIEESIDGVKSRLKEQYPDEWESADLFVIRLVNFTRERHSMDFYLNKAKELTEKFSFEIWLEKECHIAINSINLNSFEKDDIERQGWTSFQQNETKPDCPYTEIGKILIWNIGWELNRIGTIWRNAVN